MKKYTYLTVSSKLSAHDIAYDAMSRLVTFERAQGCMGGRRGHGGHAASCVEVMMIMVGLCSLSCGGGAVI